MEKSLKITGIFLILGGLGIMGISFMAHNLGLTARAELSAGKILLASIGVVILLTGVVPLTTPGRNSIRKIGPSLAKIRTWYKIHKWTTIVTGVVIVMWLITGMVMGWHKLFPEVEAAESSHDVIFERVDMSPADAVARLEEIHSRSITVRSMDLRRLADTVVYDIWLQSGERQLLDTQSSELVRITPDLAEQIALSEAPIQAFVREIERLNQHDFSYRFGPLPVYRVIFDDAGQTHAYVQAGSGMVTYADRGDRIQSVFHDTHTFNILQTVSIPGRPVTLLLWLATIATTFAALIGFYLALPRRWQISTRRKR